MPQKVAIIIPCYKSYLTKNEEIAIDRCKAILNRYPVKIVVPEGLQVPADMKGFNNRETVSFPARYFNGISGYNELMLSALFYERFLGFEYILIYQLDAFVFTDELLNWCSLGYDYIGAPWLPKKTNPHFLKAPVLYLQRRLSYLLDLKKRNVPNKYQFENKVGNGGFSLRRVNKFYRLCEEMPEKINLYLSKQAHQYNEDAFWGLEVNRFKKQLHMPGWREALQFSFETYPARALELNGQKLPFGCHDWDHYPDFWRSVFENFGYQI